MLDLRLRTGQPCTAPTGLELGTEMITGVAAGLQVLKTRARWGQTQSRGQGSIKATLESGILVGIGSVNKSELDGEESERVGG